MSTAVDTCEEIIQDLVDVGLLGPQEAAQARLFRQKFPDKKPRDLTNFLADQGHLTRFQADIALRGATRQLVMPPFVLTEILGSGSMGQTVKAKSREDDGWYAIKAVPRKNILNLQSVADQVEQLKAIRHPRVSAMIHVGIHLDRVFLVWPFLDGGEKLEDIVLRHGRLAPRAAVQIAQQIASGLKEYHAHGLFHGLLKPNDILIGSDRRVRILDFGVGFLLTCERGKSLLSTTTNAKAMTRGVDCASPESLMDPLDRTVLGDQYSLGCILYFCLTGQFPFPDTNPVKKMLGHQFEEPAPLRDLVPEVPARLANVVARMLAKKPEDRYPGIEGVIQEFQAVVPLLGEAAPPRPASGSTTAPVRPPSGIKAPLQGRDVPPKRPSDQGATAPVRTKPAPPAPKAATPAAPRATPATPAAPRTTSNKAVRPSQRLARANSNGRRKILLLGLVGLAAGLVGGLITWLVMHR